MPAKQLNGIHFIITPMLFLHDSRVDLLIQSKAAEVEFLWRYGYFFPVLLSYLIIA